MNYLALVMMIATALAGVAKAEQNHSTETVPPKGRYVLKDGLILYPGGKPGFFPKGLPIDMPDASLPVFNRVVRSVPIPLPEGFEVVDDGMEEKDQVLVTKGRVICQSDGPVTADFTNGKVPLKMGEIATIDLKYQSTVVMLSCNNVQKRFVTKGFKTMKVHRYEPGYIEWKLYR